MISLNSGDFFLPSGVENQAEVMWRRVKLCLNNSLTSGKKMSALNKILLVKCIHASWYTVKQSYQAILNSITSSVGKLLIALPGASGWCSY